ncbi:MAG: YraN family protein [Elusimicrobia bacterium RIFOXYA2_FULL_40_6]|nr:MAG: YraN family protein [Elusimicrobia bacterium RIFOXYA2_FULL_40_6]
MENYKQVIGRQGEDEAVKHLLENGYLISDRNFKTRFGEIDIIAFDKNEIVFVEVKKRTGAAYGIAQSAVDFRKQRKLAKMAFYYIKTKHFYNRNFRFDVLAITDNNLELIKNAFIIDRGYFY